MSIGITEIPTFDDRDLHCPKIIRADTASVCCGFVSRSKVATFNSKIPANVCAAERQWGDIRSTFDARHCFQPVESLIHILETLSRLIVLCPAQDNVSGQHIPSVESCRYVDQFCETSDHQTSAHQQHEAQRHFTDYERVGP